MPSFGRFDGGSLGSGGGSSSGAVQRQANVALTLDATASYEPMTVDGTTIITINGTTLGASATMVVIANGLNVPTVNGADEWASSFGFLNTAGVPNLLTVWYDGTARRYSWSQQKSPTSTLDADYAAWLNRVSSAGGNVSTASLAAVRAFIASAKAKGYWSTFRRLNLVVGDATAARVPLINTSGASADTGTVSYGEATGFQTNGVDQHIETGYTPTEATGGLSVYLRTTQPSDTTVRSAMGAISAAPQSMRISANMGTDGAASAGAVGSNWGGGSSGTVAGVANGGMTAGLWHATRVSDIDLRLFRNGTQVANQVGSVTPASPGQTLVVFGRKSAGAVGGYLAANSQIAAYAVDSGMTPTQAAAYYTDLQAFQVALGRSV